MLNFIKSKASSLLVAPMINAPKAVGSIFKVSFENLKKINVIKKPTNRLIRLSCIRKGQFQLDGVSSLDLYFTFARISIAVPAPIKANTNQAA